MTTLSARPVLTKTRVLFDATRPRNRIKSRLARFGLGIDTETAAWVPDGHGSFWSPELFARGPRVEPLPRTDREMRAFELGFRAGYGLVDPRRILSFIGWAEGEVGAYWVGYRTGLQQNDTERLEEQAEVDRRYDAMYAASHPAYEDEVYRVDFGWDAERGGV